MADTKKGKQCITWDADSLQLGSMQVHAKHLNGIGSIIPCVSRLSACAGPERPGPSRHVHKGAAPGRPSSASSLPPPGSYYEYAGQRVLVPQWPTKLVRTKHPVGPYLAPLICQVLADQHPNSAADMSVKGQQGLSDYGKETVLKIRATIAALEAADAAAYAEVRQIAAVMFAHSGVVIRRPLDVTGEGLQGEGEAQTFRRTLCCHACVHAACVRVCVCVCACCVLVCVCMCVCVRVCAADVPLSMAQWSRLGCNPCVQGLTADPSSAMDPR